MSEYFDITCIFDKQGFVKEQVIDFLKEYGFTEGENRVSFITNKQILISFIEEDENDFEEIIFGIEGQYFHKSSFEKELNEITSFVNQCFNSINSAKFALCSYELNAYLLSGVKKLKDFNYVLFDKFPIVYIKIDSKEIPIIRCNFEAQDIFCND
jgi:hypothetical protein